MLKEKYNEIESLTRSLAIPQWLESLRLADYILAEGYENTPAEFRAALKTGLAFSHAFYGEWADFTKKTMAASAGGFCLDESSVPASFAVAAFPCEYAAAPRLAAALMAARLAGTRHILAFSLGGVPTSQACAALELAGVEDIFTSNAQEALKAVTEMAAHCAWGRLAVLGAYGGEAEILWKSVLGTGLPIFAEQMPPIIEIQNNSGHNRQIIAWGHPDAREKDGLPPDVFYCAADSHHKGGAAPLTLGPGLEACWIHPGLDPGFFRQRFVHGEYFNDLHK